MVIRFIFHYSMLENLKMPCAMTQKIAIDIRRHCANCDTFVSKETESSDSWVISADTDGGVGGVSGGRHSAAWQAQYLVAGTVSGGRHSVGWQAQRRVAGTASGGRHPTKYQSL